MDQELSPCSAILGKKIVLASYADHASLCITRWKVLLCKVINGGYGYKSSQPRMFHRSESSYVAI